MYFNEEHFNKSTEELNESQALHILIIINQLKNKADELLGEEKAEFRAGRRTVEHIFNLFLEKILQKTLHDPTSLSSFAEDPFPT
ncbi:hypothetical protein DPMN_054351 [Dreissena polymorpha]|uniref:Uncharacterized protein n=1 Tax=Dreissena polymorpha TaxID=45954 RepID=A0A9D4HRJ6_DREPO|nr:hypothetical protein DPMN_054351 [Dreissena polymorpha]